MDFEVSTYQLTQTFYQSVYEMGRLMSRFDLSTVRSKTKTAPVGAVCFINKL